MLAAQSIQRLQTSRLLLRPMDVGDTDAIAAMQMDPQVMLHYGNGQPLSKADAEGTVVIYHIHCRKHGYWAWAVTLAETGEVLGQVTAGYSELCGPGSIELGFILKRAAWGKGYGTEAVKAVIDHDRSALGWTAVGAGVSPLNTGSIRLCEKVGMSLAREEPGRHGRMRKVFCVPTGTTSPTAEPQA